MRDADAEVSAPAMVGRATPRGVNSQTPQADLPPQVHDLALRLGADPQRSHSTVRMKQRGAMRQEPGSRLITFRAQQTIAVKTTAFSWRARSGPFGAVSVTDFLRKDSCGVRVRLLGAIPLATFVDTPAARKGETMRYLAELPWAPDAILWNPDLAWRVVDERTLMVSLRNTADSGQITFRLASDGLVASFEASARPRIEGKAVVERPWRGRMSGYRVFAGRTVPSHGEVSWLLPSGEFRTWEGDITDWALE